MIAGLLPDLPKAKFSLALLFVVGAVSLISVGSLFVDPTPLQLVDRWLHQLGVEKPWPLNAEHWIQERSSGCTKVATGVLCVGLGFTIYQADEPLASTRAPIATIVAASALIQLESGWSEPAYWVIPTMVLALLAVRLGEKHLTFSEASGNTFYNILTHLLAPGVIVLAFLVGRSRNAKTE